MVVGPSQSSGGSRVSRLRGDLAAEVPSMFAIGIGFLVLFSVISVLLGHEDPRHDTDPRNARDTLALWARFSTR